MRNEVQRCSRREERMLCNSWGVVVEIWAWVDTSKSKAEEMAGRTTVGCCCCCCWWRVGEGEGGEEMAF